ncbi:MAG: ABC transporter substrate-binding protein [Desulfobacterales bacterium]|nr:ABC transporter substrate-binding protein [Desulfobacterales bacterium]
MTVKNKTLRIAEAARSVFYIPILATVEAGFLAQEGYEGILGPEPGKGADRLKQLNQGIVDVLGNTPTLSFLWLEQQVQGDLPVQVATVNHRDGFFLVGRKAGDDFRWKDLEGAGLVTSNFSLQPLASLRLCLSEIPGVDADKIRLLNDYANMALAAQAFRDGVGDFVHLQEPFASVLVEDGVGFLAASVGESLGPLAFSTLAMSRKFIRERADAAEAFMRAYHATLRWLDASTPEEIVSAIIRLFEGTSHNVLVRSVKNCKAIGCWQPDPVISRESYERMVDMWIQAGHMKRRYPFEQVVYTGLAEK